jgi:hypothetical protein
MVIVDELRGLLLDLESVATPPQPSDEAGFDTWSLLVEIDSELAGMIQTVLAGGRVDWPELRRIGQELSEISEFGNLAGWRVYLMDVLRKFQSYI